ncbi:uncharacterized protein B0T15DRAFT_536619 [Chaetomium strumarium]|uniref:AT hook domain-containing protein n=1 Tax=Chaetomium strumarium TaxID=1170767 RepID=A0AAJ0GQZ8_9PEZI|nr:hypothetical protein B0T15DRAFT_536619 [Chaetomium strumarium]
MRLRREVVDSEDELGDLSGGSDLGDGADMRVELEAPLDEPRNPEAEGVDTAHTAGPGTRSTDPSFFQRVYDEQQEALDSQNVVPDTVPAGPAASTWTEVSSAPPPGQKPQVKDHSSLTSVRDPTPATRRSRRAQAAPHPEAIDLTDITTPRREEAASGESEAWDVPTSVRSQRATRTYGKRKTAGQQLGLQEGTQNVRPSQDPYAFPESSPPTGKRTRRGTPSSSAQQAQDSSPVMLVPTEEPVSSDRRTRSRGRGKAESDAGSSMPDTTASLFVTQSALTASQKQEYRMVSQSSQAVPEAAGTSPPRQHLEAGEMHTYKSSMATTIAYPTPSRIWSSRRVADEADEADESIGDHADRVSPAQDIDYQQSSPDVLADMATNTSSRSRRSTTKPVPSAEPTSSALEQPPSTRRSKRRRVVQDDDPWQLDPLAPVQECRDGQQSAGFGGESGDTVVRPNLGTSDEASGPPDIEATNAEGLETPISPPKAVPKKRGRKRKASRADAPPPETDTPTPLGEAEAEPAPAPTETAGPPAKRKRGRPRKSNVTQAQAESPEEPGQQHAEGARGETETDTALQPPPPSPPPPTLPLSEVSRNSQPKQQSESLPDADAKGNSDSGGESKENDVSRAMHEPATTDAKTKEPEQKQAKLGVLNAPQKVQYRVGLSKRSRIAPLLKSLKKPV